MRKGFSLMELIVAITAVVIISGGSLIYLNNFNSRQKLEKAKNEVISSMKLAQSYAKTRQLPIGSPDKNLEYVQVQINGTNLVAGANGIGSTFFSKKIAESNEISLDLCPSPLYFWNGNGKLTDMNGVVFGDGETATMTVTLKADVDDSRRVTINSLGQILNYD